MDRFANALNKKVTRFYSRFYEVGCEGTDAFNFSWEGEHNWLVPPLKDIPRVISILRGGNVSGVLIVPHWPSAAFWPLLRVGLSWHYFITDIKIYSSDTGVIVRGSCPFSLIGSGRSNCAMIALKIRTLNKL